MNHGFGLGIIRFGILRFRFLGFEASSYLAGWKGFSKLRIPISHINTLI